MIGQSFVFVCVSLAVVAASCTDIFQTCGCSGDVSGKPSPFCVPQSLPEGSCCFGDVQALTSAGQVSEPVTILQAPSATPVVGVCPATQSAPAPGVIAERCICTQTVVRPQVIQRVITVPRIHRFIKRTVTPVIEHIVYKATPVTRRVSGRRLRSSSSGRVSSCTPVTSRSCC